MKKIIIIFAGILIAVFAILSILDTSKYVVEKQLWRIQKQFDEIARDPGVVPDKKFENVVNQYKRIINKFGDSELTPKVYLQIGRVYALAERYDEARAAFSQAITESPNEDMIATEALVNIGKTYELENRPEEALAAYKKLWDTYPLSEGGLNMPLYISNYYLTLNRKADSQTALGEAVRFYKKVSEENPDSRVEFNALRLLITAYFGQQEWSKAVDTLGKVLLKYPGREYLNAQRANLIVKSINTIAATQLKDYNVPISIYQKFVDQNPGHPLNKTFKDMIEALRLLKEESVNLDVSK